MAIEAAVGRLLTSAERAAWPHGVLRSAFVIGERHVLSAWHCVAPMDGEDARIWLRLQPWDEERQFVDVPVRYEAHVPELDAVLLELDTDRLDGRDEGDALSQLGRIALPLGTDVDALDGVRLGGHPDNPARYATLYSGNVESADQIVGRRAAIRVYVRAFAARYPDLPDGMSGGPLLRRGPDGVERVVGIVSVYPRAEGGGGALGGTVLCRRVADLREHLPAVEDALSRPVDGAAVTVVPGERVYLSAVSGALDPYREAAAEVCRRHGLLPVYLGSQALGALASPAERRAVIETCRVFVLLLGDRFPEEERGLTELEYDAALGCGALVLPYEADDGFPWSRPPRTHEELNRYVVEQSALTAFKERVADGHPRLPMTGIQDFRLDLFETIARHRAPEPARGEEVSVRPR